MVWYWHSARECSRETAELLVNFVWIGAARWRWARHCKKARERVDDLPDPPTTAHSLLPGRRCHVYRLVPLGDFLLCISTDPSRCLSVGDKSRGLCDATSLPSRVDVTIGIDVLNLVKENFE